MDKYDKSYRIMEDSQIYEYCSCPFRYSIIYENDTAVPVKRTLNTFLQNVTREFFTFLYSGEVKDMPWLKERWDAQVAKNKRYFSDKTGRGSLTGLQKLYAFWKIAQKKSLQIVDLASPYELLFPGVTVVGKMLPVSYIARNKKYYFTVVDYNEKSPDRILFDSKIEYTMQCMAWRKTYDRDIHGIRLIHVATGKEYYSLRGINDFRRLSTIVESVSKALRARIFFPNESYVCASCQVKDICRMWS